MAKIKRTNNLQNTIHKTKDLPGCELECSRRVSSSCSIIGTCRVTQVANPVISHEWGKDRKVSMTSGTYQGSFVTQMFHNDGKTSELMISTWPIGTLGSVASLLAATLYHGNPDRNHAQALEYRINWKIYIQALLECWYIHLLYINLHINGKFTMGKLKSCLLW
jgi:hypothetical protein